METTAATYEKTREARKEYDREPSKKNLDRYNRAFEEHRESAYRSANAGAGRGFSTARDYKRKSKR